MEKAPRSGEDPVVPPAKLHNYSQTSFFVRKMMKDGGLDLQESRGNREVNRFNLHFEDRIPGTCWGLDLGSKRKGWTKNVLDS